MVAVLRVFAFCAAFPFFSNIDERAHFDLILKYARGGPPMQVEKYEAEAIRIFSLYGSEEYQIAPEIHADGRTPPPLWTQSADKKAAVQADYQQAWAPLLNFEATSAPAYYGVAAGWLKLGELVGLKDMGFMYWLRFMNAAVAGLLVWLGYKTACEVFPDSRFSQIAVAALLAFMPQDAFYAMQSDGFSSVGFGVSCILLLRYWHQTKPPGASTSLWTGLALVLPLFVKLSNLPLCMLAVVVMIFRLGLWGKIHGLKAVHKTATTALVAVMLPMVALWAWNYFCFGDIFGAAEKMRWLGWTHKPASIWLKHPIFTVSGFYEFWSNLMASFWRGEMIWHGHVLSLPAADVFYWVSSIIFPGISLWWLGRDKPVQARLGVAFLSAAVIVGILFLVLISVIYDFGQCYYPSADYPYFTSGRLIAGVLIPFGLLYVAGVDVLACRLGCRRFRAVIMAAILIAVTLSEAGISRSVFESQYNWYHLF